MIFSVALLSYIVSALMGKPDWSEIGHAVSHPEMKFNLDYISTVIGIIGTTIAPWMQFYMQSAVIEKGLKVEDYKYTLLDVTVGCVATIVVAFFSLWLHAVRRFMPMDTARRSRMPRMRRKP